MGTHGIGRRLLACMAVLVLSAGCAGNASLTPTPPSTPGPTAAPNASPAPAVTQAPSATQSATGSPPPGAVSQPQTIHLIEHATNVNSVEVGSLTQCTNPTSCQGDYLIGDNPMFDAVTGKEVGTITFECFFIDTGSLRLHCPGSTLTLTDRGQIVINEIVDLGGEVRPANGTITGGTGEFLGATGTVTSGNRDFLITITR